MRRFCRRQLSQNTKPLLCIRCFSGGGGTAAKSFTTFGGAGPHGRDGSQTKERREGRESVGTSEREEEGGRGEGE